MAPVASRGTTGQSNIRQLVINERTRRAAQAWPITVLAQPVIVIGIALVGFGLWFDQGPTSLGIFLVVAGLAAYTIPFLALSRYPHSFLHGSITTERLTIRPVAGTRIADYLDLLDDEFLRIHHWDDVHRLATERLLTRRGFRRLVTADVGLLHALDEPDHAIGFISLTRSPQNDGRPMVGVHLRPGHRGRGLGSEALQATLPAMAVQSLRPVHLACDLDNARMIAVAERAGMNRLPDVERWRHADGTVMPAALFVWPESGGAYDTKPTTSR